SVHRAMLTLYLRLIRPPLRSTLFPYTTLFRSLALDEMHMYDMYTPLVQDSSFDMPYEEAKDWMVKALQPMGQEYIEVVEEGLNKDRKSTRLNSSHVSISYAVFCLKKKKDDEVS